MDTFGGGGRGQFHCWYHLRILRPQGCPRDSCPQVDVCGQLPANSGRIPAARVHNPYWALALICVALWGYATWSTMGLTFPSDLFPHDVVGSVTGLSGLAAGLIGAIFTFAVGIIVDRFSYTPAFFVAALLPVLATIAVLLLIRPSATAL